MSRGCYLGISERGDYIWRGASASAFLPFLIITMTDRDRHTQYVVLEFTLFQSLLCQFETQILHMTSGI